MRKRLTRSASLRAWSSKDIAEAAAWLKERIPLGRVAEPMDCVGATQFFCSSADDYVTGQILYLDGGITASQ